MPGPDKKPLTDSLFLPQQPLAGDGGIADMLAQIRQRAGARRQGWGTGFADEAGGPRDVISPMDSISASDSAGGVDISEAFPSSHMGSGGAPAMALADDGFPEGDDYGDDGPDSYEDGDEYIPKGIPAQPAQYGRCGPGGCGPALAPGFAAPSQHQAFDTSGQGGFSATPQSLGLPPGAQIISERVVDSPAVGADTPGALIPSLAARLQEVDDSMPPIEEQTFADRAAAADRRASIYRQRAADATDLISRREAANSGLAWARAGEGLFQNSQKQQAQNELNKYTMAINNKAVAMAEEAHALNMQDRRLGLFGSPERSLAEAKVLRNPGIPPSVRAQQLAADQRRLNANNKVVKEGQPLAEDNVDYNVMEQKYLNQAVAFDVAKGVALFDEAQAPWFGVTADMLRGLDAGQGTAQATKVAMGHPVFAQAAQHYARPGISDEQRRQEITDLFNYMTFEFAMSAMRTPLFSEGSEGEDIKWDDYWTSPEKIPDRVRIHAMQKANLHVNRMQGMISEYIQMQNAAAPAGGYRPGEIQWTNPQRK
jgi:hypothetical protein